MGYHKKLTEILLRFLELIVLGFGRLVDDRDHACKLLLTVKVRSGKTVHKTRDILLSVWLLWNSGLRSAGAQRLGDCR